MSRHKLVAIVCAPYGSMIRLDLRNKVGPMLLTMVKDFSILIDLARSRTYCILVQIAWCFYWR